jgi:D-beta-D-heptose 7-phosphate kinase / D-beta-D-heptose 1-phosphate adenosyltransferase
MIAALGAGLAAGLDPRTAAKLANTAAGIVVGKPGTAVAYASEITAILSGHELHLADKVQPRERALDIVARWRRKGLRIGFTNGCFDLLHPGHVALLGQAKAACDRLVVGLNSDESTARLKGPNRPIQHEGARAAVLASIAAVDLVVVFEEDTPLELIRALEPQVLVKGADYRRDQVVGADLVEANGGKVVLADLMPGYSTTATIARFPR